MESPNNKWDFYDVRGVDRGPNSCSIINSTIEHVSKHVNPPSTEMNKIMLKLSFRCGNELKDNVQLSVNTKESILNLEKQYFKNSDPAFDEFTLVSVGYQKNDEWCNIIETNFDQSMHNLKMPENSTILYTYKIPEQAKVTENVEPPYDDPNDVNMCESDTTINDQDNNLPSYCPPEPDPLQEKSKAEEIPSTNDAHNVDMTAVDEEFKLESITNSAGNWCSSRSAKYDVSNKKQKSVHFDNIASPIHQNRSSHHSYNEQGVFGSDGDDAEMTPVENDQSESIIENTPEDYVQGAQQYVEKQIESRNKEYHQFRICADFNMRKLITRIIDSQRTILDLKIFCVKNLRLCLSVDDTCFYVYRAQMWKIFPIDWSDATIKEVSLEPNAIITVMRKKTIEAVHHMAPTISMSNIFTDNLLFRVSLKRNKMHDSSSSIDTPAPEIVQPLIGQSNEKSEKAIALYQIGLNPSSLFVTDENKQYGPVKETITPSSLKQSNALRFEYKENSIIPQNQQKSREQHQTKANLGQRGLNNIGNSCFMNSALQCLSNVPQLTNYFIEKITAAPKGTNPFEKYGEVAGSYAAFIYYMWCNLDNCASFSPNKIKESISRYAPHFSGYSQQDAHEFMSFLIDSLHEDVEKLGGDTVVARLFHGQINMVAKCFTCLTTECTPNLICFLPLSLKRRTRFIVITHVSSNSSEITQTCVEISISGTVSDLMVGFILERYSPIEKSIDFIFPLFDHLRVTNTSNPHHLPLDKPLSTISEHDITFYEVKQPMNYPKFSVKQSLKTATISNIHDCLKDFLFPEVIDGDWYCQKCQKKSEGTKKIDLVSLPPVLIIQLKRFIYNDDNRRCKNTSFIKYPMENFDLKDYVQNSQQSTRYNLIAVSNHLGSIRGGHYTTYAKNFKNHQWYHFDDTRVSHVTGDIEQQIVNQNAYVLIYLKDTPNYQTF